MEAAIQTVVKVFLKSSKGKETLGKKEFQTLVKSQLSNVLTDTDSKDAINNMGQGLDADQDGKVGFEEYMKLVGYLAVSISEQRILAQGEPEQNAASGQAVKSAPEKEEKKPEANAEGKEEAKPQVKEEPKAAAATAELKVEDKTAGKVEVKAEGEAQPQVAKVEPAAPAPVAVPAAAAAAAGAAAASVEVFVTEEQDVEDTEKVEEAEEEEEETPENETEAATS